MELRLLRAFATVAEQHSFSRAAELLEVTQGAVSQQVAALEKELDVTLLERRGRTVKLSEQGRVFYDYVRQILDLAEAARRELTGASPDLQGTLRIATSTVPAEWLLPKLLSEFCARHEKVNESVSVSDSATAIRAVQAGAAEIGFVGGAPHSTRLVAETIAMDELVLVTAATHRFAENKSATMKQLRDESFVMREPGSGSRHCVEQTLEEKGVSTTDLRIVMEVNSNDALRAAVRYGVGIAFLSKQTLEADAPQGLVAIPIRGFRPRRGLYLVTDPDRVTSTAARAFIDFVRENRAQLDP